MAIQKQILIYDHMEMPVRPPMKRGSTITKRIAQAHVAFAEIKEQRSAVQDTTSCRKTKIVNDIAGAVVIEEMSSHRTSRTARQRACKANVRSEIHSRACPIRLCNSAKLLRKERRPSRELGAHRNNFVILVSRGVVQ